MNYDHNYYWRKEGFVGLRETGEQARLNPAWRGYSDYCLLLEKGLRKQALQRLADFIKDFKNKTFDERKEFVGWLFKHFERQDDKDDYYCYTQLLQPYPLQQELIKPTLEDWMQVEPNASEPHRWTYTYDSLVRALELNPQDDRARVNLIYILLSRVEYVMKDLLTIDEAKFLAANITNENLRSKCYAMIEEERQDVLDGIKEDFK